MVGNYLKISLRSFKRQLPYSMINLLSLTIGLTCVLLIYIWAQSELSMDQYHANKGRLYQMYIKSTTADGSLISMQPTVYPRITSFLSENCPEIERTAKGGFPGEILFRVGDKRLLESGGMATEPAFFDLFTVPFIKGDRDTALSQPSSIVLTESLARKFFGDSDPMGKTLSLQNQYDFTVTGIVEDFPVKSSLQFRFFVPYEFLAKVGQLIDGNRYFPCDKLVYVLLKPGATVDALNRLLHEDTLINPNESMSLELMAYPFVGVYRLNSNGNQKIAALSIIALLILLIACMNYTNLATARAMVRIKEIGMRKVTGATRRELVTQFLSESLFMTFPALLLALIATDLALVPINNITGLSLEIPFSDPLIYLVLPGLTVITALVSGFYPAFYLSRFRPTEVLKQSRGSNEKGSMRTLLIVGQFVVSIVFIIATLVVGNQIGHMKHFNLGVNKNNIIYITLDGSLRDKPHVLEEKLSALPQIVQVTTADQFPTAVDGMGYTINALGTADSPARRLVSLNVDYRFLETFSLEMQQGRFFEKTLSRDQEDSIIVNETALEAAGPECGIGKPFLFQDRSFNLIGVIKDFHHDQRLTGKILPLTIRLRPEGNRYLFVKIDPSIQDAGRLSLIVGQIRSIGDQLSPDRPLRYQFLSDFSLQEERDLMLTGKILKISSGLAIFISCVGLFGLSAFMVTRRTKEIGIRKVVGASVLEILTMLTQDFTKWIVLANLIAWPIAWYTMHLWLENFAFRTPLTFTPFLFAAIGSLILAVFTIIWQTVRAAGANPIQSLRYE